MRGHILFSVPVLAMVLWGCGGADPSTSPDPGGQRPLQLLLEAEVLAVGESSTGTVNLSHPAPDEGAEIALSANDDALALPATITIASGDVTGTFVVTNSYGGDPKPVMIAAAYDSASAERELYIPCLPPEPVCKNHSCTK
jgi:hypothetical protein